MHRCLGARKEGGTFECLGRGHVDFPGCRLPPKQLEGAWSADIRLAELHSMTQACVEACLASAPTNLILWHCRFLCAGRVHAAPRGAQPWLRGIRKIMRRIPHLAAFLFAAACNAAPGRGQRAPLPLASNGPGAKIRTANRVRVK